MNNGNKDKWSEAIDRARDLFNQGWKELGSAAELAKEKGDDAWTEAQKRGRDAWVNAKAKGMENWIDLKERSLEGIDDVQERGEELMRDAERLVRKHPSKAVGLMLLVGVFVGALMSRDRD
jgi:ElaB/YqjD/DUF883 family membrane-anchored ribosome-binding protein